MRSQSDKVAVVTGGGSGIGRETAIRFAERGNTVVVADIDVTGGNETVTLITEAGGTATFVETDVTNVEDVETMVQTAVEDFGGLDYAFNNAGVAGSSLPVSEYSGDEWREVIEVNLVGIFNCIREELREMQGKKEEAVIVNNASVLGKVGFETASAYVAAKHGVLGLTKTTALENADAEIRVNAVCPGFIETPLLESSDQSAGPEKRQKLESLHPMDRLATPSEVAAAVLWLCSDATSFITGLAMDIDGGYLSR